MCDTDSGALCPLHEIQSLVQVSCKGNDQLGLLYQSAECMCHAVFWPLWAAAYVLMVV